MYWKSPDEIMNFAGLRVADLGATTAYMVVDLSDTTNWKHQHTGHLDLHFLSIMINATSTFVGNVCVGFLGNVDATQGDIAVVKTYSFGAGLTQGVAITDHVNFDGINSYIHCGAERCFLPYYENNTAFQTDVNLIGPSGNAAYPSGDGDIAMLVNVTAGNVSIGLLVGYVSHE